MNEYQLKKRAEEVLKPEVEVVNEMTIKIIKGKDQWFSKLAERIGKLIVSKNTEESLKEN
jgi:hypothetical protein